MTFWDNLQVLVTGGAGFVGSHLVEQLIKKGSKIKIVGTKKNPERLKLFGDKVEYIQTDLMKLENCIDVMKNVDIVFHLASIVAGIGYNIGHHADMYRLNSLLNFNVLEASRIENVERYQCTSSTCVYPRDTIIPTPETEGFVNDPEPTVIGYGWAKRTAEIQSKLYSKDYDMKISIVRPTNIYGPRDNFDPKISHVIPALIKKIMDATDDIIIWGSGNQTRSFIFVKDATRAMIELMERYTKSDPINIGTEEEVTIKNLVSLITSLCDKDLNLIFDKTKPEGQPRKFADISKIKKIINWKPEYSLENGLEETIKWYKYNPY